MIKLEKISLTELTTDKILLLNQAIEKYITILSEITDRDNLSQQHIHLNLANLQHFELTKKLMRRDQPVHSTIKFEISSAFVVYDALQNYTNYVSNSLDSSRIGQMIMELFSKLPNTSDKEELSINSKLNFNA
ncbi:hypothetical protein [Mesonia aestuariivivens]|uniref:Uncharacterized protein n=1 Tax=Mesonia aestuariivivens TaxID=2796128 RepID=A0ABS6W359_9FLAO|nr:hypothetical protein [Mesonia aestuariivivens]MBW2962288.1 hypothetical protein [Mesonia aestuariivivens]